MANHVLLNNIDHKDLRIITTRAAHYGDNVMCALTFPGEFRSLQAHYPIFFRKHPDSGQLQAIAMFGFEDKENLFLEHGGWDASYLPLSIECQPFLIGFQSAPDAPDSEPQTVIHIDMASPRVSQTVGEAVFLEHGGLTEYLTRINAVLRTIDEEMAGNQVFIDALLAHDLLESFTLDVELNDGSKHRLMGFYTINESKLGVLDGPALAALNHSGHLAPIYMAVASLSNIRDLIRRRNARIER